MILLLDHHSTLGLKLLVCLPTSNETLLSVEFDGAFAFEATNY
jgi:hypothetical protein